MIPLKPEDPAYNGSWGTPPELVTLAKFVLGEIDLDPFSSAAWNANVGARWFYDGASAGCGFADQWGGRVLCNPPGPGELVKRAWAKLLVERATQRLRGVIWVSFNLEDLRRLQGIDPSPLNRQFLDCRVIPKKRLHFIGSSDAPMFPNAVVWVPPPKFTPEYALQRERWLAAAAEIGEVF